MKTLNLLVYAPASQGSVPLSDNFDTLEFIRTMGTAATATDLNRITRHLMPDVLVVTSPEHVAEALEALPSQEERQGIEPLVIALGAFAPVEHVPGVLLENCPSADLLNGLLRRHWLTFRKTGRSGKIISLFSAKGGMGVSTLAWNLAYELKVQLGDRVLLIDADQVYNNQALRLALQPTYSLADLAAYSLDEIDDGLLLRLPVAHESGVHVLSACKSIHDANPMITPELFTRCLDAMARHYDYILVDLPSMMLDPLHQAVVDRADEVLLVSDPSLSALFRSRQYLSLAAGEACRSRMRMLLNRTAEKHLPMPMDSLGQEYGLPVLARVEENWVLAARAENSGSAWSMVEPDANAVKALRQWVVSLADLDLPEKTPAEQPRLMERLPLLAAQLAGLWKGVECHVAGKA